MSKREEIIKLYFLEGEIPADIAKKLDYFTELNAELNAELLQRKKQYEYYRNKLLNFK